jgi:hypothetical protein
MTPEQLKIVAQGTDVFIQAVKTLQSAASAKKAAGSSES